MRFFLRKSKYVISALAISLLIGLIVGYIYQRLSEVSDLERWPPPGELVEVDGRLMHIYCKGEGSPTVLIENGYGGFYDSWKPVLQEVSEFTKVCSYDRAGTGYSDPLGYPVGTEEVAERLNSLLQNSNPNEEIILVGWSSGGLYVREFYRKFPENVKGMVLVDSSHELQRNRLINPEPPAGWIDIERIASYLGVFGLIRLSGQVDQNVDRQTYVIPTEDSRERMKVIANQSHWLLAYLQEWDALERDFALNKKPPSLRDLPLVVLTRGREVVQGGMPSYYTLDILRENERNWQEMQKELVELSSDSHQIVIPDSGHRIDLDAPQVLINAIRDMTISVR